MVFPDRQSKWSVCAETILGLDATEDALEALRQRLGLNEPLTKRYFLWIGNALTGNFGISHSFSVPVSDLIIERDNFLTDYLSIIIFLFIALFLSVGFVVANYLASPSNPDPEKLSAYECGFDAFDDSRMEFDVRFYLVAILFIIFDLEIAFLFPWAITLGNIGIFGFVSMMIFLSILTVGFIYEWKKGALDWE